MNDRGADGVEEPGIVRHDDRGHVVEPVEVVDEPANVGNVQVVCWLQIERGNKRSDN